jgi:DNA-binding XRE family transcriptional regulator
MIGLKAIRRINPITKARSRLGLSRVDLSRVTGVHVSALLHLERGCYSAILPTVLAYFMSEGFDVKDLQAEYRAYQNTQRIDAGIYYDFEHLDLGQPNLKQHPMISLREQLGYSRDAFAKTFCIHPAALQELERGDRVSLPEQVVEALEEAGLREEVIAELNFRVGEFRDYYLVA